MIASQLLPQIADAVEQAGSTVAALAGLRASHPDLHFTGCLDDDVLGTEPVLQRPAFNLYLVDGRDHCLKLTNDLAAATGILVAEIIADA